MPSFIRFLRSSVRGRVVLLVISIALPSVCIALLLTLLAYRHERQAEGEHLIATARTIAALVDQRLGRAEAMMHGLAASRDLTLGDFEAFHARASKAVQGPDQWVVLADAEGQQLVNTRVPFGTPLRTQEMTPDFRRAAAQGRTYISNVEKPPGATAPRIYVSVPILENGRIRHTLSYVMLPGVLTTTIDPKRFAPGTVTAITDREGTILAREPNGDQLVGTKVTREMVAAMEENESIRESVTLEGRRVLASHSRSPISGWSVAIGVPFEALYAPAERLLWVGLAASAVLLTTAMLMAAWIGRALVRGVDALVADTEVIGRGGVPAEGSERLEEISFVAQAMRKTAARLQERDRENAELTRALQVELEKQRREKEKSARLAAIVECSDDAIISKSLDGVITSWNGAAQRIFGYTAAEIVGRAIQTLTPSDRLDEESEILSRMSRGERLEHFETLRRRKDGVIVPVSLTISPVRDERGGVVGVSTIARDVSQRHRAETEQRLLYELVAHVNRAEALQEIYDAALIAMLRCADVDRAAILLCDPEGVMRFTASIGLSETCRRSVEGHSPWQGLSTRPQPIKYDDVANADLARPLRRALLAEGIRALAFVPLTYEKRLLGKFVVYFNAPRVITTAQLRPVETFASQVAFAIERQRGAEALELLVSERTASLRQVIAQMEEFSYSVSHDLRAPVRAMRGYADVILQDHGWRLDAEGRELVTRIARNGFRMDRLIQDLLTYSRISRRELQLEPVSLDKLVREVMQQYPDMRPERADIEVEGPLPDVIAHEPSLTQVISNLLSNAVKFVPPQGRPRVRVGYDRRESLARLWILDNGIGIKPEHQTRLFGMFERIHTEAGYEGTGIGLAIVRKAVERMNGAVGVESDGVSGSKFWFELPLAPK